jgi:hypothetical protein
MQVRWENPRAAGRRLGAGLAAIVSGGRFSLSDFRGLFDPRFTLPDNGTRFAGALCACRHRLHGKK